MIFTNEINFSSSNFINKYFSKDNKIKANKLNYSSFEEIFKKTGKLKVAVVGEINFR